MKIRIGYLGNPHTLLETFHTITLKKYKNLKQTANFELDKIIISNLKTLDKIIEYNKKNNIYFYRIIDNFLPLATIENIDYDYKKFENEFRKIGNKIIKYNMRVDIHADHFCILNSTKNEVIENSFRILKNIKMIFDMLNINSKIIIHIGSKEPCKEIAMKRFENNFKKLPIDIQQIIVLENDDHIYTISDTLNLCEKLNIPMVLDFHHFKCHHSKNEKIEKILPSIFKTWENTNLNPKIHFSSPKNKKEKRTHHFYINYICFIKFIEILIFFNQNIDIMLESKGKDEALFKLLRQLKFYKKFNIKKNEIIF